MFAGERKKKYQKEYMREYMKNRRARAVKTPMFDVKTPETEGLVKTSPEVKTLLSPPVKTQKTKDVFIGGRKITILAEEEDD